MYAFLSQTCSDFLNSFQFTERGRKLDKPIMDFCKRPSESGAGRVYEAFLHSFRIPGLEELLTEMHKFEVASSSLLPHHRDHYIHTVNVFLLGVALYAQNRKIKHVVDSSNQYADKYDSDEEEFIYRWGLTALFHDVGYPLQIAYETIHEFMTMLIQPNLVCLNGEILSGGGCKRRNTEPIAILRFPDMKSLLHINFLPPDKKHQVEYFRKYPELKSLPDDLISAISATLEKKLMFSKKGTINSRIQKVMTSSLKNGLLDHGIYSSIVFLKWINDAFSKAKWNPAYFYFPVLDAGTAIFLHNSYDYIFRKPPFNLPPLHIEKFPLAFLLILCDRVQETERTSYGYQKRGINFASSSLEIDDKKLLLRLYIPPDEDKNFAKLYSTNMKEMISKSLDICSIVKSVNIEIIRKGRENDG